MSSFGPISSVLYLCICIRILYYENDLYKNNSVPLYLKIFLRFLGINLPTSEQVAINRQVIPEDKQDSEYLTIDATDDPSIYGEYECQATNELGQANKTVVLLHGSTPSAISDVSVLFKL